MIGFCGIQTGYQLEVYGVVIYFGWVGCLTRLEIIGIW